MKLTLTQQDSVSTMHLHLLSNTHTTHAPEFDFYKLYAQEDPLSTRTKAQEKVDKRSLFDKIVPVRNPFSGGMET